MGRSSILTLEFMQKLFACVLVVLSLNPAAASGASTAPDAAKVLVLGLPQFEAYFDITEEYRAYHILTNSGQNLIRPILSDLEEFRPSVLSISWDAEKLGDIQTRYDEYTAHYRPAAPTFAEQVGFTLAATLRLPRIFSFDLKLPDASRAPRWRQEDLVRSTSGMLSLAQAEAADDESAAAAPALNSRLSAYAAQLAASVKPDDRILILCPAGYAGRISAALGATGNFEILQAQDVLHSSLGPHHAHPETSLPESQSVL